MPHHSVAKSKVHGCDPDVAKIYRCAMKQSKFDVRPDTKGNVLLRVSHVLDKKADTWEEGGVFSLVLAPADREALIEALVKCR